MQCTRSRYTFNFDKPGIRFPSSPLEPNIELA